MVKETLVGVPSHDRPWMKFYGQEVLTYDIPEMKIYDYVVHNMSGHENLLCLEYFGAKITYKEFFNTIETNALATASMVLKNSL